VDGFSIVDNQVGAVFHVNDELQRMELFDFEIG